MAPIYSQGPKLCIYMCMYYQNLLFLSKSILLLHMMGGSTIRKEVPIFLARHQGRHLQLSEIPQGHVIVHQKKCKCYDISPRKAVVIFQHFDFLFYSTIPCISLQESIYLFIEFCRFFAIKIINSCPLATVLLSDKPYSINVFIVILYP